MPFPFFTHLGCKCLVDPWYDPGFTASAQRQRNVMRIIKGKTAVAVEGDLDRKLEAGN